MAASVKLIITPSGNHRAEIKDKAAFARRRTRRVSGIRRELEAGVDARQVAVCGLGRGGDTQKRSQANNSPINREAEQSRSSSQPTSSDEHRAKCKPVTSEVALSNSAMKRIRQVRASKCRIRSEISRIIFLESFAGNFAGREAA